MLEIRIEEKRNSKWKRVEKEEGPPLSPSCTHSHAILNTIFAEMLQNAGSETRIE